MALMS